MTRLFAVREAFFNSLLAYSNIGQRLCGSAARPALAVRAGHGLYKAK